MYSSYFKHTSRERIESDLALMYEFQIDSLKDPGENKEFLGMLILILNLALVYPDSLSNIYFICTLYLLISGAYDVKRARELSDEVDILSDNIYHLLLPSLIICDKELPPGDFYLYDMLIKDIKKEYTSRYDYILPSINRRVINELITFINKAYKVIDMYLDKGYDENTPEIEDIKQLIIGFITEMPYYENENIYYEALSAIELKLASTTRKRKPNKIDKKGDIC